MYGLEYGNLKIRWGWMSLISIVISAASVLVFSTMTDTPGREFILVADSNHIMAVITSRMHVYVFQGFTDKEQQIDKYRCLMYVWRPVDLRKQ